MKCLSIARFAMLKRLLTLPVLALLTATCQDGGRITRPEFTQPEVSVGGYHNCGVTTAGAAHCWGGNYFGELGDGTNTDSNVPVVVSGGLAFRSVSAGGTPSGNGDHSCGVTTAGTAYCWDGNYFGELGNGTNTDSKVPVLVDLTFSP